MMKFVVILLVFAYPARAEVDFARDVRPILAQNCYACHGPDQEHREAELRLDIEAGAKADRDGSHAVIGGDLQHSALIVRINNPSPKKHMPPADSGKKLTDAQIATLTQWVKEGAHWSQHWAFVPPKKEPLPSVKDATWGNGAIDWFVLAKLKAIGMPPSPAADRRTLIRRVSLDLIGLPPTPEQVEAFVADQSADAYEKLVDRLLASPAFGEKWARVWLDLARYADTKGYEKDRSRAMWPYRDWLIKALNADMPFDQFTIEQLAGDLLPTPTESQWIATTFNRLTMTNEEGGVDGEEFRIAAVKDRVDTTMQVWMGLTMGCAKCHNHKYDPITQKEYYQVMAIFNQSEDANRGDEHPTLPLLTEEQRKHNAPIEAQIAELRKDKIAATQPVNQAKMEGLRKQLIAALPLPIMRDLPANQRRVTRLHNRGSFLDPGEVVQPAVLSAFHPLPGGASNDRLGLARWIVDRHNPLTARVLVNRYWAQFFGTGIVESEEDFGSQGTPPTHRELLDWLAVDFMENGWSMKKLCKTIVLSSTYRQDSKASAELTEKDRFNRLLARGPRIRLDAETLRDAALQECGLLSSKQLGPSVMPLQPAGIWASVYSGEQWLTSAGEDRHRRGIYTFVKRTSPYPSMLTFDGTSRETCTIRRIRTNTPLQALTTLNDPVYVEAAQALARQALETKSDAAKRISFAVERVLNRPASEKEVIALLGLHDRRLAWFIDHPADAVKFASDPIGPLTKEMNPNEAAAMTAVCNVILNLDEAVTKQ